MSHINVTINGRQYRMACEEGQEVRLLKLAESFEARIGSLRGKFGEIGDARLTVMAALTVCDELLDANNRIRALEDELVALRDVRVALARSDAATRTSRNASSSSSSARMRLLASSNSSQTVSAAITVNRASPISPNLPRRFPIRCSRLSASLSSRTSCPSSQAIRYCRPLIVTLM